MSRLAMGPLSTIARFSVDRGELRGALNSEAPGMCLLDNLPLLQAHTPPALYQMGMGST